jgi:hypothetical protein
MSSYLKISIMNEVNLRYFLLQRDACFCGDSYGKYGKASESDCSIPCAANATQICGGEWRNSVYAI